MTDFHSHILPGIDDGSRSPEMSLEMLEAMARQQIRTVVATPHFYATDEAPQAFLARLEEALSRLRGIWRPGLPAVCLGAEVAFFTGISRSEQIGALCVRGTRILLVEMPFDRWSESAIAELIALRAQRGFVTVVAHIERYASFQARGIEERLSGQGILLQTNASCLLERRTTKYAQRLIAQRQILLLGSDAHNMTSRPPNLGEAAAFLAQKDPESCARVARFSAALLGSAERVLGP